MFGAKKHGRAPDPIETFDLLDKRKKKNKCWIDDASAQMWAKISKELAQVVATYGEETPDLRLQAYVRARGFETGGRVRGYGELETDGRVRGYGELETDGRVRRHPNSTFFNNTNHPCISRCLTLMESLQRCSMNRTSCNNSCLRIKGVDMIKIRLCCS